MDKHPKPFAQDEFRRIAKITPVTTEIFLEALKTLRERVEPDNVIDLANHLRKSHTVDQRTGLLLLTELRLEEVNLENVNLGSSNLTGSIFKNVTFGGAARTSFWKADLTDVTFDNTTNTGAIDARQAILKNTKFENNAALGQFRVGGAKVEGISVSDDTTLTNLEDDTVPSFSGKAAEDNIIARSARVLHQENINYALPAALRGV